VYCVGGRGVASSAYCATIGPPNNVVPEESVGKKLTKRRFRNYERLKISIVAF
jgi:hypothetical protein